MSRPAALWNARILWSRCSIFLFNSYQRHAVVIVRRRTQGDPLGMTFYGIRRLPLSRKPKKGSVFLNQGTLTGIKIGMLMTAHALQY